MHVDTRFDYTSGKIIRGERMSEEMDPEAFWGSLLSGDPALIRAAWKKLSAEERQGVRRHLQSMAEEEGWQPAQRRSARAALRFLDGKDEA
jgi:hypothetical protein